MLRRLAAPVFVLAALATAPAAAGDGPMPYAMRNGGGVLAAGGGTRFVAVGADTDTSLAVVQTSDGTVVRSVDLPGMWGVPVVTYSQSGEGLSTDGATLVLGDVVHAYPRIHSAFLVLDAKSLQIRRTITLPGDFAFDALSPDGSRLYLIQHRDAFDATKYVVRAYDVAAGRLLPGRIADRTQKGWVMQGFPMARATSADGRMVYTLYQNPGGYPFVHALDTVRGVAHCVGLPWKGDQNGFWNMRLSLRDGGRTLAVHWLSGRAWLTVDTSTWRIAPDRRAGVPWAWIAAGAAFLGGIAVLALVLRRRRGRKELERELAQLLRAPQRDVALTRD
jgi:hypothetical protein